MEKGIMKSRPHVGNGICVYLRERQSTAKTASRGYKRCAPATTNKFPVLRGTGNLFVIRLRLGVARVKMTLNSKSVRRTGGAEAAAR